MFTDEELKEVYEYDLLVDREYILWDDYKPQEDVTCLVEYVKGNKMECKKVRYLGSSERNAYFNRVLNNLKKEL